MTGTQGIKLDDDIRKRLKALADARGRSPHWLMRAAIEQYLLREEKYEAERREDETRWEHYQLTGNAVPQKQAKAWLEKLAQGRPSPWPK